MCHLIMPAQACRAVFSSFSVSLSLSLSLSMFTTETVAARDSLQKLGQQMSEDFCIMQIFDREREIGTGYNEIIGHNELEVKG